MKVWRRCQNGKRNGNRASGAHLVSERLDEKIAKGDKVEIKGVRIRWPVNQSPGCRDQEGRQSADSSKCSRCSCVGRLDDEKVEFNQDRQSRQSPALFLSHFGRITDHGDH
jgi:hypothetical protein